MEKQLSVPEMVQKLAGKDFPPEQKLLTPEQINQRMKFLEGQKRELIETVQRNYNERIRMLGKQRERLLNPESA